MKKFLFGVFMFWSFVVCGQTISGKALADIDSEYIFVSGISKNVNGRIIVEVDFGQAQRVSLLKSDEQPRMLDKDGKLMDFNSMIEVINFFTKNNYDYIQGFAPVSSGPWSGSQYTLNCLFKKRK